METILNLPDTIANEQQLEETLSRPSTAVIKLMEKMEGDLVILGIAGKMGPTLGRMASRASQAAGKQRKIFGVARFSNPGARQRLEEVGVSTIKCDLLDAEAVRKLPRAKNVIYMVGKKFGTSGNETKTWMINVIAPHHVCRQYNASRIVAFSTGCVYPLVGVDSGGSLETDPVGPVGEYAQTCVGRERIFQHAAQTTALKSCLFRLNYAVDLRYGVLHDIGQRVFHHHPVDLSASHFNVIWQGDACSQALLCLEHCTDQPEVINITGPETVSTRQVAEAFAVCFGTKVELIGSESDARMYLSNAAKAASLFGYPSVPLHTLIRWQAGWIASGLRTLDKPTHFEVTDGIY
jgi:nucleoside-diphosphate-sugar epimerase